MKLGKLIAGAAVGTLAAAGAAAFLMDGRRDNPDLELLKKYRYAHRGFHEPGVPENSIAAFKSAIERGWGCELDVHLLKDGTLAILHDSKLERCTGAEGFIEDLTKEELAQLRLQGTEEHVPLFDEVLDLFEEKAPLIIELKVHDDNYKELAEAVCRRLDSYKGDFCIESFDPRAVGEVRKLREWFCRGQLAENSFAAEDSDLPFIKKLATSCMFTNFISRPDFVAYNVKDRDFVFRKICTDVLKIQEVSWTVRSKEVCDMVEEDGAIPIFEKFDPEA